jgi:hypothetical protein
LSPKATTAFRFNNVDAEDARLEPDALGCDLGDYA